MRIKAATIAVLILLSSCIPPPPQVHEGQSVPQHFQDDLWRLNFYDFAARTIGAILLGAWTQ